MNIFNLIVEEIPITQFVQYFNIQNVFIIVLVVFILLLVTKPHLASFLHILGLSCLRTFQWARRKHISRKFQYDINMKTSEINKEIGSEILPYEAKVHLVRKEARESFINNGSLVVKISDDPDQNKSLALATIHYVNKGLMPNSRHYIPNEIMESSSLLVTRRILAEENIHSLGYFINTILEEVFREKPHIKEKYAFLRDLDSNAMFYQILIPELWETGNNLSDIYQDYSEAGENCIEELINFLHEIATNNEQLPPLELRNQMFNLKIIIVGKRDKLEIRGISDYVNRVKEGIRNKNRNIYLLAHDSKETYLKKIIKKFKEHKSVENIKRRKGIVLDDDLNKINRLSYCVSLKSGYINNDKKIS